MRFRFLAVFCYVLLICIITGNVLGATKTLDSMKMITGKIMGADGKPPILAHAHVTDISETYFHETIQTIKAKPDGRFELKIKEPGFYNLWITAVNHESVKIPVMIAKEDQKIELNIALSYVAYKNSFDEIKIMGSWDNFDYRQARTMNKKDDGSFGFTANVNTDRISYQLLGVVEDQPAIGTAADDYEYVNYFGYRSVVKVKPGQTEIVFDPSKLPHASTKQAPKISFDKNHQYLGKIYNIVYQRDQTMKEYRKALTTFQDKNMDRSKFGFDFSSLHSLLENSFRDEKILAVQQFAAVYLIQELAMSGKFDSKTGAEILKIVPPNSSYWSVEPNVIMMFGYAMSHERPNLFKEFYEQNPNRKVKAKALVAMIEKARNSGDQLTVNRLYAELRNNFGDIKELQYEIARLNPDKRIGKGKPVPEFAVKLLGSSETVTNKSLLGKYYLIDFWASYCSGCKSEIPNLQKVYEKYHDLGLEILSLSLDNSQDDIEKFKSGNWKMPWYNAWVSDGYSGKLAQDFEVKSLPKPVFIGPDGNIVATEEELRGDMLEKTLEKLLGNQ